MDTQKLAEDILLAPYRATQAAEVTCKHEYYDAASLLLEDEAGLWTHDNANELGGVIEQWIKTKRDNYDPTPV